MALETSWIEGLIEISFQVATIPLQRTKQEIPPFPLFIGGFRGAEVTREIAHVMLAKAIRY